MQPRAKTDQQLIIESLHGSQSAFGELFHRYWPRLLGSLVRMLPTEEDSEDLAQETFLLAYRSLRSFRGESNFFTWLYKIGLNIVRGYHRKRARTVDTIGWEQVNHILPTIVAGDSTELCTRNGLPEETQHLVIQSALKDLAEADRQLIVMKYLHNQQYTTIAASLSIPVGTVRSRLHRVRKKLHKLLEEGLTEGCR